MACNAQQPGLEGSAGVVAVAVLDRAFEDGLNDIVGIVGVTQDATGETVHSVGVTGVRRPQSSSGAALATIMTAFVALAVGSQMCYARRL
jgi:hypothetical protein